MTCLKMTLKNYLKNLWTKISAIIFRELYWKKGVIRIFRVENISQICQQVNKRANFIKDKERKIKRLMKMLAAALWQIKVDKN